MCNVPWQFCFRWCAGVEYYYNEISLEVIKFCCNCVGVEDSVSEVKGYQLERLLQDERRDAKFYHDDVWGGETV